MVEPRIVDLLVVGSGAGLAAAVSARELGADVLVIEKTDLVGGSTARSGGAFWVPANPLLAQEAPEDTLEDARTYLEDLVGDAAPRERWESCLEHGPDAIRMLQRTTRMQFSWARGYSDYHPERPGGSALGRSCESRPFDAALLGRNRTRLRPATMAAPIPMPVTGADYKWLNLMLRVPQRGLWVAVKRAIQGLGGLVLGRRYVAGGQALAAGLYDAALRMGVPVWTRTALERLVVEDGQVTGAIVRRGGELIQVTVTRGVVLAAGGFDHELERRRREQSALLGDWSLGADGNTGDAIAAGQAVGAGLALMDQAWWFPAVAPLPGERPVVLLAERSLPGSFMVDQEGRRFINEATDYMSFGQELLRREREGRPVREMWLVFDQSYRNRYLLGGSVFPRMPLPKAWYDHGIAVRAGSWRELASRTRLPADTLAHTAERFAQLAAAGVDDDFHRGGSAYDRYYGDPTVRPNPNLRPLDERRLYAVRIVLSDLGTCGGLAADEHARVLTDDGQPIPGLYAIGNTAANVYGNRYPGAGATIGQGLVMGHVAARHALSAAGPGQGGVRG
ncbi:3-ketosteroid-delta-1-dehydrogenase [Microbacterium sp. JZ70]